MIPNKILKTPPIKLLINDDFNVEERATGYYNIVLNPGAKRWTLIASFIGVHYTKEDLVIRLHYFKEKKIELSLETELWIARNK